MNNTESNNGGSLERVVRRHDMRKMTDEQIREWNATFKPGHPCWLRRDNGDELSTRIRSEAWRLGSGHVVVMVEGVSGGWDIDRVKMAETHAA